ncbi:MAG: hypothetical protein QOH95_2660 [Gaiellaceae bacterium]|jgi:peptidoglycan/LPS O-acetylase OafA/YrhL|nr:hypothetical protein [Gaiellaceae bacterium]
MQARRLLLGAVVGALCLTASIAIVVLLSSHFDDTSWRILGTTSAISFFGLLGVPFGLVLERGRAVALARAGGALTVAAFVLTLVVIWRHWSHGVGKTWGVVLVLAVASAQAAVVEARRRDTDTRATRRLSTASMLTGPLLAALGIVAILAEIGSQTYYRVLGALAVVHVLLLVIVAVLRRGTGPVAKTHRIRLDGELIEAPGRDFAAAVAAAIRSAEKDGAAVRLIERA